MSDMDFPIPFKGCTRAIHFYKQEYLNSAVEKLLTCGHCHNFAVQTDGLMLYLSGLGVGCIYPDGPREKI